MSESMLIERLVQIGFPLFRNKKSNIKWATEVRALQNRADLVYFEKNDMAIGSIFAIEAKLHDWKTAIKQAYRNKLFANKTFVALPEQYATAAISNIQEFQRASVGLVIVKNNSVKIYYNPPINRQRSEKHVKKIHDSLIAFSL